MYYSRINIVKHVSHWFVTFATALALIAVACAICVCAGCGLLPSQASDAPSTSGEGTSAAAQEQEDLSFADVEDIQQQEGPQSGAASPSGLAWRDADFVVDPNRTNWNFESNGRKVVYLTIDDGPSANTQAVLDILDRYGCKATFFVIGADPDYFPMIGEAYRRGHTIGLHSFTHDYAYVYSSTGAYYEDLASIGQVVQQQIGYVPCFIRFPGGSSNAISADYCAGIMSELVNSVQANGYQYYDWNMSTGDGAEHTAGEIVGYATAPTELDNIVLLCHDSAAKQSTVEALPAIIEHYQALGYSFEALDRGSYVPHHGVNN